MIIVLENVVLMGINFNIVIICIYDIYYKFIVNIIFNGVKFEIIILSLIRR